MATALQVVGGEEAAETAKFVDYFFDCLYVDSGKKKK